MKQYINARIFTGEAWLTNAVITEEDGVIVSVGDSLNAEATVIDCSNHILIAALVDLQQYGLGGKLFSAYPEAESLAMLADENKKAGVSECLATIATQPSDVIFTCIDAIKSYWKAGGTGILGMHLEGPFMNVKKRGAHHAGWIHEPTPEEANAIIDAGKDVIKIVTLAPECCSPAVVKMFLDAGIQVSAGHSNASYEQAKQFSDGGIRLVTHLYNAMSSLHHRDTGLPGAVFEDEMLMASIIPDGIHVSYSALAIAKKQMGDRLFFITDSVTDTAIGPYQHWLNNDHYCTADGTLSGSAITMLQGIRNVIKYAGIGFEEAVRMATLYPAKAIGVQQQLGSIEVGRRADFLLLDDEYNLVTEYIRR